MNTRKNSKKNRNVPPFLVTISPEVRSVLTQVKPTMNDFSVQCVIKQFDYVNKEKAPQSDYESSVSEYHQGESVYDDKKFQSILVIVPQRIVPQC